MSEYAPTSHGDLADHWRGQGVLSHVEDVKADALAGAQPCPYCFQQVHADNWQVHHQQKHTDQPLVSFHDHYSAGLAMIRLPLSAIVTDGGTQSRSLIVEERVKEYAERLIEGDIFPPLVVFYDGSRYWLADGFHRLTAARYAKLADFVCDIRQGTQRDAIWFSTGANAKHGLPRTPLDKQRAVQRLLNDPEWAKLSNHEIARHCVVSHTFVGKLRKELSGNELQINPITVTRNGKQYEQKRRVKPALRDDAPDYIQTAVERGDLGTAQGNILTAILSTAAPKTGQIAHQYQIMDVETISLLNRLETNGAETVDEVLATGYIQISDETDAVPITAPATQLQQAVAKRAVQHKLNAVKGSTDGKYSLIVLELPTRLTESEIRDMLTEARLVAMGDWKQGLLNALATLNNWEIARR